MTVDGAGAVGFLLQAPVVVEKLFVYPVAYPGIIFPRWVSANSVEDRENGYLGCCIHRRSDLS